jgi:hypothetical protein
VSGVGLPPDDTVEEHALLVARGVRPMALVAFLSSRGQLDQVYDVLRGFASKSGDMCLPFVVDDGNGRAYCGFAAAKWVIELLGFVVSDKMAANLKHEVIGLMLGYSPSAIQWHRDFSAGALFVHDSGVVATVHGAPDEERSVQ